jgi:hypothetical protein
MTAIVGLFCVAAFMVADIALRLRASRRAGVDRSADLGQILAAAWAHRHTSERLVWCEQCQAYASACLPHVHTHNN